MTTSLPAATASAPSTTMSMSPQSVTTAPSKPHSSRRMWVHKSLLPPAKVPFTLLKEVIRQWRPPSSTATWKGLRYSSRSARWLRMESTASKAGRPFFTLALPRR